jgi:hypothetical protein
MVPRWVVVDKLVHELGSLRAVVQEVEARPEMAENDVTLELRASLARAADTIHLVIGGDEGMLSQAWRCIAEAQEVGGRARVAFERARASASSRGARRGKPVTPAAPLSPRDRTARERPQPARAARPPRS